MAIIMSNLFIIDVMICTHLMTFLCYPQRLFGCTWFGTLFNLLSDIKKFLRQRGQRDEQRDEMPRGESGQRLTSIV